MRLAVLIGCVLILQSQAVFADEIPVEWNASEVKKEIDAFLATNPPFPCLKRPDGQALPEYLLDLLEKRDAVPPYGAASYPSPQFPEKPDPRFPERPVPALGGENINSPATLFILRHGERAISILKKSSYADPDDHTPTIGDDDPFKATIYSLVEGQRLDAAVYAATFWLEWVNYTKGKNRGKRSPGNPRGSPIDYLVQALILDRRYAEAEQVDMYRPDNWPKCHTLDFARYAYYSDKPKHQQFCACHFSYLRQAKDEREQFFRSYTIKNAACISTYPDFKKEFEGLKVTRPSNCYSNESDKGCRSRIKWGGSIHPVSGLLRALHSNNVSEIKDSIKAAQMQMDKWRLNTHHEPIWFFSQDDWKFVMTDMILTPE